MNVIDLSVVVPAFNEELDVARTLLSVDADAQASQLRTEIVVVDDGSEDGTAAVVEATKLETPLTLVRQENRGLFGARLTGIENASGTYVLLFDAGLVLEPGSLSFLHARVTADPDDCVWTGHTYMAKIDRYVRFWNVLTGLAWADYLDDPREVRFGEKDFDRFPKGGGCFFAPRALLLEGCRSFRSYFEDSRHSSDDTALIRWIAGRHDLALAPAFAYTYRFTRASLRGFLRHARNRGIHFLDGHGRRASRFFPLVLVFYPASVAAIALVVRSPLAAPALLAAIALGAGAAAAAKRRPARDVSAFGPLAPLFALAHGSGMWIGLGLAVRDRLRRAK